MSDITIINGQPQGLDNKMVTYDGLVDFLEMLKNEIPRMGYKNSLSGSFSYTFGNSNACQGDYSLLIGEQNHSYKQNNFLLGIQNKINIQQGFCCGRFNEIWAKDQGSSIGAYIMGTQNMLGKEGEEENSLEQIYSVYILGSHNSIKQEQKNLVDAYGFGRNLTLMSKSAWFGCYNDPKSDVVFGIGNGISSEKPSNLFEITNDGAIRLGTASLSKSGLVMPDGIITLGTTASISESQLIMPVGTISVDKVSVNQTITSQLYAYDLIQDSTIVIKDITIRHTEDPNGEEQGIGIEHRTAYRDGDDAQKNAMDEPVLLNGGLRPVFRPWSDNEMLWVTNIHKDNKDTLHINFIDQTLLNELHNPHWHIPSTIHFHAGREKWATLKCNKVIVTGNIHGVAKFSGPQSGGDYVASWQVYSSGLYSFQLINNTTVKELGIIYIDINNATEIQIGEVSFSYDGQGNITAEYFRNQGDNTDIITAVWYAQLTVEGEEVKQE